MFNILCLLYLCGNREYPGSFQNKSLSSPFNWVYKYILFMIKLKTRGRPFLECARRGATLWDYPQEHLVVIKDENVCPLWNLKWSLCCLLDPLTNKHCRAWSSMVDLWIDSRTSQKCRILLSARQKSNNYLELPSYSGEYDAVTLTMLYLKVLHDLVPQNSSINFLEAATIS